ncbi:hypothetical protein EVAR_86267_1 [Eumeta japonica]|uniref:Uncharacterized protein n=1 Tax=Eumeta variegata TaxID=151549 RepID=A0A4C1UCN4_EUMVA|nr:hypothetical protein EVAR_86267_1 [Eumeta japonica]
MASMVPQWCAELIEPLIIRSAEVDHLFQRLLAEGANCVVCPKAFYFRRSPSLPAPVPTVKAFPPPEHLSNPSASHGKTDEFRAEIYCSCCFTALPIELATRADCGGSWNLPVYISGHRPPLLEHDP